MAKLGFSTENKAQSAFDYPKLWLDKGDRARIVCIEPEPEFEFVHTLRAPQIVNGQAVTENVRQKDGSYQEQTKFDFIGRHICFGNLSKLQDKGKDPENCPTCAKAQESEAVGSATRRFAMHVVRYKTQPGSFKAQDPFQAELVAWTFTDRIFNQLVDIMDEHGDLRKKDLLLGPCENKFFQKFDIQVGGNAEWLRDKDRQDFVKKLYHENQASALQPLISRKLGRELAEEDVQKVLTRHQIAFGGGMAATQQDAAPAGDVGNEMDLDSLLGDDGEKKQPEKPEPSTEQQDKEHPGGLDEFAPKEPEKEPETTSEDPPGISDAPSTEQESKPEEEKEPAPAATGGGGDELDFDELLKDL